MIAMLIGTIVERAEEDGRATVLVGGGGSMLGGVGYDVGIVQRNRIGDNVRLHIRSVFSETNGYSLWGFDDAADAELFDDLREVKGVGPSIAHKIVRQVTRKQLDDLVRARDPKALCKLNGVGKILAALLIEKWVTT